MAIVATGMHASFMTRAMIEGIQFIEGQRIHIGPQADRAPLATAQHQTGHHAGAGDPAKDLQPQSLQKLRHHAGGAMLAESELGVGMNITANRGDARDQIGQQEIEIHGKELAGNAAIM